MIERVRIDGTAADLVPIASLGGLAITGDGGVVATQPQDHRVVFFSPDGELLASFGRSGSGPGEFRRIFTLGLLGDSIWVWDAQLSRATLIGPGLELLRT
ncbi:MAG: hypothetical protein ACREMA_18495, partial [Longimicrobiales bacterium]